MTWRDIHRVAVRAGWSVDRNPNEVWLYETTGANDMHFECHGPSARRVSKTLRALCETALEGMIG